MFTQRIPTRLWRSLLIRWRKADRRLASPVRFRKILCRERARTALSGQPFCLLVFSLREPEDATRAFAELDNVLQARLRCTDTIGWLDREHMAAALPATPREGAAEVADDICLGFSLTQTPPLCEIYCYPADPLPGPLPPARISRLETVAGIGGAHERKHGGRSRLIDQATVQ